MMKNLKNMLFLIDFQMLLIVMKKKQFKAEEKETLVMKKKMKSKFKNYTQIIQEQTSQKM